MFKITLKSIFAGVFTVVIIVLAYFGLSFLPTDFYDSNNRISQESSQSEIPQKFSEKPAFTVTHVPTPNPLKAIYMTQCVAATPSWRKSLLNLVEMTEINSIVIDIKDYSGTISFKPEDKLLRENGGIGCRISDLPQFIDELHKKGIYVIGRITVFQDPFYTKIHPELAVKKKSDGSTWRDRKGLSFVDVGAKPFWDYIVALSKESYKLGFDELNFDYIRFPSDGDMKDIWFSHSDSLPKSEALEEFFIYLHNSLKDTGAVLSADLFGMTTTNQDDLNIGQILEKAFPYFDYIAPMVYPSHYPPNFNGWKNPNHHPYDVIYFSLSKAVERAKLANVNPNKIRPWLQDFDYGGNYGPAEVRAQIQATYDAGLTSWMLWDPANKYTKEALLPE